MVALKGSEVDAFVARPDASRRIVLVFGPDAGLVRERVEALVRGAVDDPNDPFSLSRIEGDVLSDEPSRLVEEAHTVPLFGGRRAVRVRAGNRNFVPAVDMLIASPPSADCLVVIEAGDLRRNAPLRVVCERAAVVAVLPCYADNERDLARLIDTELRAANLSISGDARTLLIALIGGDREASRNEIRKLALYAHGKERIEIDDVLAVVADASALALDAIVDAAFGGQPRDVETQYAKARASGTAVSAILSAALRHVGQLHRARTAIDSGAANEAAGMLASFHFRRKPLVENAVKSWTAAKLEQMMGQLAEAALEARRRPALADAVAQRTLLMIALTARRRDGADRRAMSRPGP
jgi:DNA polymerase-3 subunit delta